MQDDFVFRFGAVVDQKAVILQLAVLLFTVNHQAVAVAWWIIIDAAQPDANGSVFVVVLFAIRPIHDDVTSFDCMHVIFVILIPEVTV